MHWLIAFVGFTACLGFALGELTQSAQAQTWSEVTLKPKDRILILAPHPDDEVLGCGGIIQKARSMGLPLTVVFLTHGDSNQWSFLVSRKHPVWTPKEVRQMGLTRQAEAIAATEILGLPASHLIFLGYPDYGTLDIWYSHWGDHPPLKSMLTRVSAVPYEKALRFGAAYKGEEVLQDLETVLRQFRPTKVFVSHPADSHPDHRAAYLFTRVALWDLEPEIAPELYPYLIHFKQWPRPQGDRSTELLEPPGLFQQQISWQVYLLASEEIERKRLALKAHRTQYESSAHYLLSFIRPNELFGDFPVIPLPASTLEVSLSPESTDHPVEAPEELTDQERAAFVGLERRFARLEGADLVLSIELSRPLVEAVSTSVYIFGYRSDRPFNRMPKIHVKLGAFQHAIYDQDRPLPPETFEVSRQPKQITLRIPLRVLGNPQRILTSARTYLVEVPLDWVSWRILELSGEP